MVYLREKLNQELIPIIAYVYTGEEQFVYNDWWCIILFLDDVRLRGVLKVEINTCACLIVPEGPGNHTPFDLFSFLGTLFLSGNRIVFQWMSCLSTKAWMSGKCASILSFCKEVVLAVSFVVEPWRWTLLKHHWCLVSFFFSLTFDCVVMYLSTLFQLSNKFPWSNWI